MKLLILTQKVDRADPVLGFFHRWIIEFVKHYEGVTVIGLEVGRHELSNNIRILSLGKETGKSRLKYLFNFYKYIWQERKNYDAVFVHMNQEYVLLGGLLWIALGKNIFMWRNHHAGSILTHIAVRFCHKVFCTSKYSYTAKYGKTVLMPVGVDTDLFVPESGTPKMAHSILFLSRMAPVKKPHLLIESLGRLKKLGINFVASFYGDPLPRDQRYYKALKSEVDGLGLADQVVFRAGVANVATVAIYNRHEIFVNLSSSGMYDKTIFEAAACGAIPLSSNENLRGEVDDRLVFQEANGLDLTAKLQVLLNLSPTEVSLLCSQMRDYVLTNHSLDKLGQKLFQEING